jgi:hypothetical protein
MVLTRDGKLLFLTRFIRLFSYGMLAIVLVLYLTSIGLSEAQTGLLMTLTLAGDTAISLVLTTQADRVGRRRMLIVVSMLMAAAGWHLRLPTTSRCCCWPERLGLSVPAAMKSAHSCQSSRRPSHMWFPLEAELGFSPGIPLRAHLRQQLAPWREVC